MTQSFVAHRQGRAHHGAGRQLALHVGLRPRQVRLHLPGADALRQGGDTVKIVLKNTLAEDVSIVFPGIEGVKANGILAGPQFDAGGHITSLTNDAGAGGGSVTYTFKAASPGTYLYESGTDQAKQVQMGLFGALVVRPVDHTDRAYDDARTAFDPSTEFLALLSDIDVDLHAAVERGQPFDIRRSTRTTG